MEFDLLNTPKTTKPYLDLYRRWKSRKHKQNSLNNCITLCLCYYKLPLLFEMTTKAHRCGSRNLSIMKRRERRAWEGDFAKLRQPHLPNVPALLQIHGKRAPCLVFSVPEILWFLDSLVPLLTQIFLWLLHLLPSTV